MSRYETLVAIFDTIEENKKEVIQPILTEVVFMEQRLDELRALPHIRIHPKDKSRQEITPAGKQYKETMQAYLNAVKVLLTALYRVDSSAADELLEKLKEFET